MNQDIIIDILKILKSKKSYGEYCKLRASGRLLYSRSISLFEPTILEFNFRRSKTLSLPDFLDKGSATIFWNKKNKKNETSDISRYCANIPISWTNDYKRGRYKIFIFAEDDNTSFSSESFYETCFDMINFIKIGKGLTSLSSFFAKCHNVNIHLNHLDLSRVSNIDNMFFGVRSFNYPIGDWDVSNITRMEGIFYEAKHFNQPIGDWDVSNVVNMVNMFYGAKFFNQPIGDWDVSNVIDMSYMFHKAKSFNQPIGNWDVSSVTNMSFMFYRAKYFNQPIGDWDVSNVTYMLYIFSGAPQASSFSQSIGNWDISNVESIPSL